MTISNHVKEQLNEHIENMKKRGYEISYVRLQKAMMDKLGHFIHINTVRNIFKEDGELKLEYVVAICEIMGLNLQSVLPKTHSEKSHFIWDRSTTIFEGVRDLDSSFYRGKYICFYFRPLNMIENRFKGVSETENQEIISGELELSYEQGRTIATFKENIIKQNFDGTKETKEVTLHGEAELLTKMNQVYIDLMDTTGKKRMIIMFPWIELSRDNLYSQQAAVFTVSGQQNKHPLFQKMAIFRKGPPDNVTSESIIRGMLSLDSDDILIEAEKFNKLSNSLPAIKQFQRTETKYYEFSQSNIISSIKLLDDMDYLKAMEYIMQMRKISYSPGVYTVEEHERYNIFSRSLQNGEIT